MSRKFSCREPVYLGWENAVKLLPDAGIDGLEVSVRPLDELQTIAAAAADSGVELMTMAGGVKLDDEASMGAYVTQLDACAQVGIPIYFTSASGGEQERGISMGRLRELAAEAAARDMVIALETHPPFCQNADGMLATMDEVGHPNLGVNLDTANIFYYNEGLDSADELERVIDHVVSLHLKDTDGGFKSPQFPVLGEGVVRFERIFEILDAAGFDGPMALELEGPVMSGKDVDARHQDVKTCMAYLRSIGVA